MEVLAAMQIAGSLSWLRLVAMGSINGPTVSVTAGGVPQPAYATW